MSLVPFLPVNSQTVISAGTDTTICLGGAASLNAVVTGGGFGTDSYTFEIYTYSPEAYTGGTGVTFGGNQDDQIAGPFDIGFPFCFFNQTYTQFYIGSNGWIGFTYNAAWTTFTSAPIPNTAANCPKNCIMAPWEDWWPGYTGSPNPGVFYYLTGTAPNRKLVVYWPDCYEYWCRGAGSQKAQFQIVLNEQTSIVENHLTNKPLCTNRTATQGVHNATGTIAFTATGRNSTLWSTTNESTRFVPSGIKWYVGGYPGGTIVGYGATLNIASTATTTYTAVVETCGGVYAIDDVVVTVKDPEFSYPAYSYCKDSPDPVATILQPGGLFTSAPPGLVIDPFTGAIDIANSSTGTYNITYTISTPCTVAKSRILSIWLLPVPNISGLNSVCPSPDIYTYSTETGNTNYLWQFLPDGNVTAGGTTGSDFISLNWSTTGPKTISVNYTDIHGCIASAPTIFNLTVNPIDVPQITGEDTLCQGQNFTYSTQAGMNGYNWIVTGGNVTAGGTATDPFVTVSWNNAGVHTVSVLFNNIFGCHAVSPTVLSVLVKPLPFITQQNLSICSRDTAIISLQSTLTGSTFSWTCTPESAGITGFSPGSGNTISQILFNANYLPGWVLYHVTALAEGCAGPVTTDTVVIRPSPTALFSRCFDTVTFQNAAPILLRGGVPYGGSYCGNFVAGGYFNPQTADTGLNIVCYTYNNVWNCSSRANRWIRVLPAPVFNCGDILTDPRDGKTYNTVLIGSQCWMAANLNYGSMISSTSVQRENCIIEKYCYGNNSSGCASWGGLYQWDEMMAYLNTEPNKGICPPGWHLPSETEWFLLFGNFINNGFSANALKATGFSGFNALLSGAEHSNKKYSYSAFATFHWSSSSHGSLKAWAHGMNFYDPSVSLYPSNRNNAFSVRCIKD